ncbi:MAG: hypothetical protein QM726_06370 [Chitinophagaceae bacterium]
MKTLQYCLLILFTCMLQTVVAQVPKLSSYPAATATVFIDFDGQYVSGTAWNMSGDINAAAATLSNADITEIFNRVAEDYRPFNLNVTTDSTVYWSAPKKNRIRIIVTPTSQWYGMSGGVAYVGSFLWGDNTPAWVFSTLLGNRPKWVAEAISHEAGHTLGLQHQSVYDAGCNKTAEYSTGLGTGEIGWAPIMGAGYYQNHTTWQVGPNTIGCNSIQNDFDIIKTKNGFGLRADDHGDDITTATSINLFADAFTVSGLVNTAADVDVFKLPISSTTFLHLSAIPQNVGTGDDGANVDIKISLMNGSDTINSYNPSTLLNAGVDTNLNAGTYYLVIDGVGNMYHNDEGSIGLYTITGNILSVLPITNFNFSGKVINDKHQLSWMLQTDESVKELVLETSTDAIHFSTLATLSPSINTYSWQPIIAGTNYYRLRAITNNNAKGFISNTISLQNKSNTAVVQVMNSNATGINLQSSGDFNYQLFTMNGQMLASGRLRAGANQLPVQGATGVLLLHCSNSSCAFTQKLIKQ